MSRSLTQRVSTWGVMVAVLGLVMSPAIVSAANDSDGTTVSATVGSTISVTTSGNVTLSLAPVDDGVVSSSSHTVTVSTNNTAGYTLTLANADDTSSLVNGGNSFTAHDGTPADPTALTNGTWGFAIAGSPFDTSYVAENSSDSSTTKWAGVPTSEGTAATLKSTATTTGGDVTTVWYAAKADATQPAGTYTDSVLYTATTN